MVHGAFHVTHDACSQLLHSVSSQRCRHLPAASQHRSQPVCVCTAACAIHAEHAHTLLTELMRLTLPMQVDEEQTLDTSKAQSAMAALAAAQQADQEKQRQR